MAVSYTHLDVYKRQQRQLILDIILEEECSCCKEIYYKVQEKDRNIGPATIYRMVNMLSLIHI